ncbi:FUSC family protein [Ornithinimicrobium cavernae]|uniref:FUSC family protein n=1 Tax=Ornithinimicrobium cavernae TaxID=2666047 RepID=UPI000D69EC44|nr:aromatic acid exporter family protein [Ornithinimicrobium cavernae]
MAPHRLRDRVAQAAHHPVTARALKSGLAAGVSYLVGSTLPEPLDGYSYYAAMGAFTVVLPAVADSLKSALRTVLAILLGIAIAVGLQSITSTTWWVIALAVAIAVVAAALPVLHNEASWAPLVALFVLAFGGEDPQLFVLGYLTQVPLGAAIGITINVVLVPPLPVHDLEKALRGYRFALGSRLEELASALREKGERDLSPDLLSQVEVRRQQVATALDLNRRAHRGNPRSARFAALDQRLWTESRALHRCDLLGEAAGVLLDELGTTVSEELRRPLAETFEHLAARLRAPSAPEGEGEDAWPHRLSDDIASLHALSEQESVPVAQRHLVATLAYTVRDAARLLEGTRSRDAA